MAWHIPVVLAASIVGKLYRHYYAQEVAAAQCRYCTKDATRVTNCCQTKLCEQHSSVKSVRVPGGKQATCPACTRRTIIED